MVEYTVQAAGMLLIVATVLGNFERQASEYLFNFIKSMTFLILVSFLVYFFRNKIGLTNPFLVGPIYLNTPC